MKIGLVGLGNMGGRITKRLMAQGHEMVVYDLNDDTLKHFVTLGAGIAHSPAALAREVEVVITVLPNAQIVKETVLGGNGIIEGFKSGNTVIDMTSSVPEVTKAIGQALAQRGIHMLDAPVSGGTKKAEDGTLAIMVGGEADVFDKMRPILKDIGTKMTHVGELGSGHTIKALNNLLCASTLAVTAEVMATGVKLGLDPNKMLEVINTSSGRSASSELKFPQQVLTRRFEVGFTLDLMCKDLKIAMEMAKDAGMPMFVSGTVEQLWRYALSRGGGGMDHTAIVQFVEEMADVTIKG